MDATPADFERRAVEKEIQETDMRTAVLKALAEAQVSGPVGRFSLYSFITREQRNTFGSAAYGFARQRIMLQGEDAVYRHYWQSFFVDTGLAEATSETRSHKNPEYIITRLGSMLVREGIPLSEATYERLQQASQIEQLQARLADLEADHEPLPEY